MDREERDRLKDKAREAVDRYVLSVGKTKLAMASPDVAEFTAALAEEADASSRRSLTRFPGSSRRPRLDT